MIQGDVQLPRGMNEGLQVGDTPIEPGSIKSVIPKKVSYPASPE